MNEHERYWQSRRDGRREPTADDSIRSIEAASFSRRPPKAAGKERNEPEEGSARR